MSIVLLQMYCTGGIRCDVYSTFLRQQGFDNLYTLEGGIQNYLEEESSEHWKGSLFVFDDRMAVAPSHLRLARESQAAAVEARADGKRLAATPSICRVFIFCVWEVLGLLLMYGSRLVLQGICSAHSRVTAFNSKGPHDRKVRNRKERKCHSTTSLTALPQLHSHSLHCMTLSANIFLHP